ncbi:MAG TPA: polysaccharide biosynthesis protein, partial [Tepidisphaeraceae bacterium]
EAEGKYDRNTLACLNPEPRTLNPACTRFVAVRFGNVLGSSGSVVPIFARQIAAGGPVTVTHAQMRRYFMTIPEASQLVMQAGAMTLHGGCGGDICVLDMGEPVRILDLAEEMIRRNGLVPGVDIDVRITGMRPGEKLFEELANDSDATAPTSHEKIRVWKLPRHSKREVDAMLARLGDVVALDRNSIIEALMSVVPEYRPTESVAPARVAPLAA